MILPNIEPTRIDQGGARPLLNETVLITGASSGLGAHFSKMLSAAGANVVLAARRIDRLENLKRQIEADGGRVCTCRLDVSDESSIISAFDKAEGEFGNVTGVVANAGVNAEGSALDLHVLAIERLLNANVKGVFLTAREAARRMSSIGRGSAAPGKIVLISSIAASHVSSGVALYSASKAAVQQLGRCLAADWARKDVNVNVLNPGYIQTDLNREWFGSKAGQKQVMGWPRRRLLTAQSLDGILTYLLSPASNMTTGGVFTIDDGQTLA